MKGRNFNNGQLSEMSKLKCTREGALLGTSDCAESSSGPTFDQMSLMSLLKILAS